MRDAAIDPPDPREAKLRRARDIQVMATTYESLRNAICMGLAPSTGIPQEARSLRENMHQLKPGTHRGRRTAWRVGELGEIARHV